MRIIDLTQPIKHQMPVYPGDPEVSVEIVQTHDSHTWELRRLSLGSHTGSHVDAFSHMHEGMADLDQIPLTRFLGPAVVVRVGEAWPEGVGLLFLEDVGLELLERLVAARPNFVGGRLSEDIERALLERGIITYTDLINLELIPPRVRFFFIGLPLRIAQGDGSPVRAIAVLD